MDVRWFDLGFAVSLVVVNFIGTYYLYGKRITDLETARAKDDAHSDTQDRDTQELKAAIAILREGQKNQSKIIDEIKVESAKSGGAIVAMQISLAGSDERLKSIDARSAHIEQVMTSTIADVMKGLVRLQGPDDKGR